MHGETLTIQRRMTLEIYDMTYVRVEVNSKNGKTIETRHRSSRTSMLSCSLSRLGLGQE
jgi:hypothetical protein